MNETYRFGNTEQTRWMSMSIAKSVTSTIMGAALHDGYIESIYDPVTRYVPSLKGTAYDGVSIRDVLMMASGVRSIFPIGSGNRWAPMRMRTGVVIVVWSA